MTKPDDYLTYFKPLEIEVRSSLEEALKHFKSLVQKEKVIAEFKERQQYLKPSIESKQKHKRAIQRQKLATLRESQFLSGEWDRIQQRKEDRKRKKIQSKKNGRRDIVLEGTWL
jgi:small subunit ribosomal protein S21